MIHALSKETNRIISILPRIKERCREIQFKVYLKLQKDEDNIDILEEIVRINHLASRKSYDASSLYFVFLVDFFVNYTEITAKRKLNF